MTFDPVSREESAARAIQRSLGALDFARRMAERPREGVERVLRETLGQTPATGGNREMTSRTDAQFARRDFVRDAAVSKRQQRQLFVAGIILDEENTFRHFAPMALSETRK